MSMSYANQPGYAGGPGRGLARGRASLTSRVARLPWGLVFLIVAMACVGTAMLYSSTQLPDAVARSGVEETDLWRKHAVRFAIGFVLMIALAMIPLRLWLRTAFLAYIVPLGLLFAVEFAGSVRGGAQRWLDLGPVAIQPSEFMKLALSLALARYYHMRLSGGGRYPNELWGQIAVHLPALALIAVPATLIFKQPDFGTTLALVASGGLVLFIAHLPWKVIVAVFTIALVSVPATYMFVLEDYQRERVDTFIKQFAGDTTEEDRLGDSYQIEQAKIAIGAGGLNGKGFTQGTQTKLDYIPEQHTDFILTVIAEEFGFIGTSAVLLAWAAILGWGLIIALQSESWFGTLAACGAVGTVGFYIFFNVGMVTGLLPVVGVPMPMVSYGGTAMITTMACFGLILSAHLDRRDTSLSASGVI